MAKIRLQYKRTKPKGASIESSSTQWNNGDTPRGMMLDELNEISKAANPIIRAKLNELLSELGGLGFDPHTASFSIALK